MVLTDDEMRQEGWDSEGDYFDRTSEPPAPTEPSAGEKIRDYFDRLNDESQKNPPRAHEASIDWFIGKRRIEELEAEVKRLEADLKTHQNTLRLIYSAFPEASKFIRDVGDFLS